MFNSLAFNPFETHQFTFTAAFLSVYYLLIDCERGRGIKTITSLTMCFMGFKRIVLLAIFVVVVVHVIHSHLGKKAGAQIYSAGLFLLAVCCFVFVVLLYNGFISSWMSGHSLNVMGRNYYWQATVDNSVFSPLYIGAGVNSLTHLFTTSYSFLHVGGVHCDILKYYYEIGFFGFLCWLGYFLVYLPAWIRKVCGEETFNAYVLITLFMFVLFFTDNVDIYYGSQLLFAAIPMVIWLKSHPSLEEGCENGTV